MPLAVSEAQQALHNQKQSWGGSTESWCSSVGALAEGADEPPRGPTSPPPPRQHHPPTRLCGFQDVDPQASTDPLSEGKSSAAAPMAEEETGYVTARKMRDPTQRGGS
ncbi:hypothetical protein AAFF_G00086090 [Aldrovandia affinis]|uniref:Uncharacterized protein n=1 Tax=Aldrovandia affinis TaxID=143900 RepID=A0AAD7R1E8_9TELE|nr:hypothetical protein AAFF_G00086090 [Aldrovandia affinis]